MAKIHFDAYAKVDENAFIMSDFIDNEIINKVKAKGGQDDKSIQATPSLEALAATSVLR